MAQDLSTSAAGGLIFAEALAHVPGFHAGDPGSELLPLAGGRVNRTWRVRTPVGLFVLRLSPAPDAWLASDRSVERALHGIAASEGLAPRIVQADPLDRWMITEFIAGPLWSDADFGRAECLAALGRTLRRLHAIAAPAVGRLDLLGALHSYARRLEPARGPAEADPHIYLEPAAAAWRRSGAPERPPAILHHDLHGSNLIRAATGLILIDWECSVVADPLLDVACVLSYFEAAREHASVLLESSGLGAVSDRQLAASRWLFDLHTWFWYRERRLRMAPTPAEVAAERRLALAVERGAAAATG